ncbi:hypothetical protein ADUPG1_008123 [Aduncisulcus paluster]|uniref:EGF-like domain-containing protein n=1 Tax=Aduncisulcus paluster TaxID=2918883 RepID=A0ABQ5KS62_9EUKA|nr:hypothetical protein ADUPG1_008123 [Aduncisulcus paluster]
MKLIIHPQCFFLILCSLLILQLVSPSNCENDDNSTTVFVSSVGDDASLTCDQENPCKTLSGAFQWIFNNYTDNIATSLNIALISSEYPIAETDYIDFGDSISITDDFSTGTFQSLASVSIQCVDGTTILSPSNEMNIPSNQSACVLSLPSVSSASALNINTSISFSMQNIILIPYKEATTLYRFPFISSTSSLSSTFTGIKYGPGTWDFGEIPTLEDSISSPNDDIDPSNYNACFIKAKKSSVSFIGGTVKNVSVVALVSITDLYFIGGKTILIEDSTFDNIILSSSANLLSAYDDSSSSKTLPEKDQKTTPRINPITGNDFTYSISGSSFSNFSASHDNVIIAAIIHNTNTDHTISISSSTFSTFTASALTSTGGVVLYSVGSLTTLSDVTVEHTESVLSGGGTSYGAIKVMCSGRGCVDVANLTCTDTNAKKGGCLYLDLSESDDEVSQTVTTIAGMHVSQCQQPLYVSVSDVDNLVFDSLYVESSTSYSSNTAPVSIVSFQKQHSGSLTISNSQFTSNTSYTSGGAISVSYIDVDISNSQFIGNTSTQEPDNGTTTPVSNASSYNGGAISIDNVFSVSLEHVTFENNTAQSMGGDIAINVGSTLSQASTVIFSDVTSSHASSQTGGGSAAIYADTVQLSNSSFSSPTASSSSLSQSHGGAVYLDSAYSSTLSVSLSSIQIDRAISSGCGGGVYANSSFMTLAINTVFLEMCEALVGGGMCLSTALLTLSNSTTNSNLLNDRDSTAQQGRNPFDLTSSTNLQIINCSSTGLMGGSAINFSYLGSPLYTGSVATDAIYGLLDTTSIQNDDPVDAPVTFSYSLDSSISFGSAIVDADNVDEEACENPAFNPYSNGSLFRVWNNVSETCECVPGFTGGLCTTLSQQGVDGVKGLFGTAVKPSGYNITPEDPSSLPSNTASQPLGLITSILDDSILVTADDTDIFMFSVGTNDSIDDDAGLMMPLGVVFIGGMHEDSLIKSVSGNESIDDLSILGDNDIQDSTMSIIGISALSPSSSYYSEFLAPASFALCLSDGIVIVDIHDTLTHARYEEMHTNMVYCDAITPVGASVDFTTLLFSVWLEEATTSNNGESASFSSENLSSPNIQPNDTADLQMSITGEYVSGTDVLLVSNDPITLDPNAQCGLFIDGIGCMNCSAKGQCKFSFYSISLSHEKMKVDLTATQDISLSKDSDSSDSYSVIPSICFSDDIIVLTMDSSTIHILGLNSHNNVRTSVYISAASLVSSSSDDTSWKILEDGISCSGRRVAITVYDANNALNVYESVVDCDGPVIDTLKCNVIHRFHSGGGSEEEYGSSVGVGSAHTLCVGTPSATSLNNPIGGRVYCYNIEESIPLSFQDSSLTGGVIFLMVLGVLLSIVPLAITVFLAVKANIKKNADRDNFIHSLTSGGTLEEMTETTVRESTYQQISQPSLESIGILENSEDEATVSLTS